MEFYEGWVLYNDWLLYKLNDGQKRYAILAFFSISFLFSSYHHVSNCHASYKVGMVFLIFISVDTFTRLLLYVVYIYMVGCCISQKLHESWVDNDCRVCDPVNFFMSIPCLIKIHNVEPDNLKIYATFNFILLRSTDIVSNFQVSTND